MLTLTYIIIQINQTIRIQIRLLILIENKISFILIGLNNQDKIFSKKRGSEFTNYLQMCLGWILTLRSIMIILIEKLTLIKLDRNSYNLQFSHKEITRHSLLLRKLIKKSMMLIDELIKLTAIFMDKFNIMKDLL